LAAASRVDPEAAPASVSFRADPFAPAAVTLGSRTVFVNPATADVYGEGTGGRLRTFFTIMVNWHRYVAQAGDRRPTGKAITGAANLAFLVIVLSGMFLWWPKSLRWAAVRQIVWFRGGLPGKARDFNWHNTLGFWSALPLALIVYSGVVISYPSATNMVYRAFGETPPAPGAGRAGGAPAGAAGSTAAPRGPGARAAVVPGSIVPVTRAGIVPSDPASNEESDLDRVVAAAIAFQPDWNILTVRLPMSVKSPATVVLDRGDGGQPHLRGTLTVDLEGRVEQWEGASSLTPVGRPATSFGSRTLARSRAFQARQWPDSYQRPARCSSTPV
jgi:uncharacterized iron-regulated membrane protein